MGDVFLHVPERMAGYPLTLAEAVDLFITAGFGDRFSLVLKPDQVTDWRQKYWQHLWFSLASNELHSFAQAEDTGTWYRVPVAYWRALDPRDGGPTFAPLTITELSGLDVPSAVRNSAVVVWQADAQVRVQKWLAFCASHPASATQQAEMTGTEVPEGATPPVADQPRGKGGRPAGKDGAPIAAFTVRLQAMGEIKARSCTVPELGALLSEEYTRLGLKPPNYLNAERNARGVRAEIYPHAEAE